MITFYDTNAKGSCIFFNLNKFFKLIPHNVFASSRIAGFTGMLSLNRLSFAGLVHARILKAAALPADGVLGAVNIKINFTF